MTQREYNRERREQSERIKRELQYDKALARLYQEGLDRIQDKIDKFYLRYAGREGLTKAEAMKRVDEMDVTKFAEFAREAVRIKDFNTYTNEVLRLYNAKMQVSRLKLIQAELELDLQTLLSDTNDLMDKARIEALTREYRRQAGILGNSATSPSRRYRAILDADFYGATFSERVWGREGLHGNLKRELFASLGRVYTDMMGYKQERDRLARQFGTSRKNAQRLLRTEMSRIYTETAYKKLVDNDFTHLIYVAEAGACPICAGLDNKAIPIDDGVMGDTLPPMHPNCRCHFYGHIKLDRKDGTSTLDEYDLWEPNGKKERGEDDKPERSSDQSSLDGSRQQRIEPGSANIEEMFSDVGEIWQEISKQSFSKSELERHLQPQYLLGNLPNLPILSDLPSVVKISGSDLARTLVKHGNEFPLEQFKLIKEMIESPDVVADNSGHHKNSLLLYKAIPERKKSVMEGAVIPKEDGNFIIHYHKIKKQKLNKLDKNGDILYKSDDF